MAKAGGVKRQITAPAEWWDRVAARALREKRGNVSSMLVTSFDAYETHGAYEPLSMRAHVSPSVTGDRMLAALLSSGSIDRACEQMGTTPEEWDRVVTTIPGLQRKIEFCFGKGYHGGE